MLHEDSLSSCELRSRQGILGVLCRNESCNEDAFRQQQVHQGCGSSERSHRTKKAKDGRREIEGRNAIRGYCPQQTFSKIASWSKQQSWPQTQGSHQRLRATRCTCSLIKEADTPSQERSIKGWASWGIDSPSQAQEQRGREERREADERRREEERSRTMMMKRSSS